MLLIRVDQMCKDNRPSEPTKINFYQEEIGYKIPGENEYSGLANYCKSNDDRFKTGFMFKPNQVA